MVETQRKHGTRKKRCRGGTKRGTARAALTLLRSQGVPDSQRPARAPRKPRSVPGKAVLPRAVSKLNRMLLSLGHPALSDAHVKFRCRCHEEINDADDTGRDTWRPWSEHWMFAGPKPIEPDVYPAPCRSVGCTIAREMKHNEGSRSASTPSKSLGSRQRAGVLAYGTGNFGGLGSRWSRASIFRRGRRHVSPAARSRPVCAWTT